MLYRDLVGIRFEPLIKFNCCELAANISYPSQTVVVHKHISALLTTSLKTSRGNLRFICETLRTLPRRTTVTEPGGSSSKVRYVRHSPSPPLLLVDDPLAPTQA